GLFHSPLEIPSCIYRKPFLAIPSRIFRNFRFPIGKYWLKPLQHIGYRIEKLDNETALLKKGG
ncbi:MAG TPA: hypothetical protein DEA78_08590, partial [Cyanobacteria bacterium UBA11159]|nr:hypothetical protein [Cyanobacteria bacterium UBA11159]HBS68820.1 hypothetical protein [Cyanobacteria bacterium UBA11153]